MTMQRDIVSPFAIRLAELRDLDGFMTLAELTGPGFTSLPANEEKLSHLLAASCKAAQGDPGAVMLAMTDRETGHIAGCAAVKRGGKKRAGFANFRIIRDAVGTVRSLQISDDYSNLTEIGSLFVHPDYRAKGVGKALAQSRYMYLATRPHTFGARVFAELRGVIDEHGASPFYDAACRPWLNMSFTQADRICAAGDNSHLVAMLPKKPILTETFSPAAMSAIGNCHESGKAAHAMLMKEGFHFDGVVDLLDGGALVAANTVSLTSLRHSRLVRIKAADHMAKFESLLFATTHETAFHCIAGRGTVMGNTVLCSNDICEALRVSDGDVIRISRLNSTPTTNHSELKPIETTST